MSSGNHGQGVALARKLAGVPVTVYAASTTSPVKLDAVFASVGGGSLISGVGTAIRRLISEAADLRQMREDA
ncbi:hypothetical protein [Burkholderia sp. Bp8963]|uniref:hypothetical protein n=1 Tax=Burkholderia sp. Bp8963 TaxID=2184547 RepID=UPI001C8A5DBF|nr:hypothetical protein [Burkholderia sp. Bp8963]